MERIVNLHLEKLSEGFYLAIGENEHLCREAWVKNHLGDDMTLDLFGNSMSWPKQSLHWVNRC